jgi:UDP-galactose transporter B1
MLGQLVLGGSKYGVQDYVFAGSVVVGTTLLSMGKKSSQEFTTPLGLVCIVLSLVADGFTAGLQKRLKKETERKPPTTYDFLLFTNAAMGAVALAIALVLGDLVRGLAFMSANPVLQQMIIMSCLLSALGQSFIFFVVAHFDPMVCATVTTTRKILSVVWSITVKGHSISLQGYFGLVLAICGILLGLVGKRNKKRSHDDKEALLC